jgi:anti-anti-sigma factor
MTGCKFLREVIDGISIIRIEGDLDYNTTPELKFIHEKEEGSLVVDLTKLEYLDSSGLGSLLEAAKLLMVKGHSLVVITNETVDCILNLTRLNTIIKTAQTQEEALAILLHTAPS